MTFSHPLRNDEGSLTDGCLPTPSAGSVEYPQLYDRALWEIPVTTSLAVCDILTIPVNIMIINGTQTIEFPNTPTGDWFSWLNITEYIDPDDGNNIHFAPACYDGYLVSTYQLDPGHAIDNIFDLINPNCDICENSPDWHKNFRDSVIPLTMVMTACAALSWVVFCSLAIVKRKNHKPLVFYISSLMSVIYFTICLVCITQTLNTEYERGFSNSSEILNIFSENAAIKVFSIISILTAYICQVETVKRSVSRLKEKVLVQYIGILYAIVIIIITTILLFPPFPALTDGYEILEVLSYLLHLSFNIFFCGFIFIYGLTNYKVAYRPELLILLLVSHAFMVLPILTFVLAKLGYEALGVENFIKAISYTVAPVVLWEWMDRIEQSMSRISKQSVLGKRIFEDEQFSNMNNYYYRPKSYMHDNAREDTQIGFMPTKKTKEESSALAETTTISNLSVTEIADTHEATDPRAEGHGATFPLWRGGLRLLNMKTTTPLTGYNNLSPATAPASTTSTGSLPLASPTHNPLSRSTLSQSRHILHNFHSVSAGKDFILSSFLKIFAFTGLSQAKSSLSSARTEYCETSGVAERPDPNVGSNPSVGPSQSRTFERRSSAYQV